MVMHTKSVLVEGGQQAWRNGGCQKWFCLHGRTGETGNEPAKPAGGAKRLAGHQSEEKITNTPPQDVNYSSLGVNRSLRNAN